MKKISPYEEITNEIIKKLESGVIPWKKPWKSSAHAPKNLISLKPYQGINAFITSLQGHGSPYWLSFKQCQDLGGKIKAGEKGTKIVFWSAFNKDVIQDNGDIEKESFGFLKTFVIFNIEQTENIKIKPHLLTVEDIRTDAERIESCENVVSGYKNAPKIESTNQNQAYYRPSSDVVNIPDQKRFISDQDYYSVLFHELSHSTGHSKRLARKGIEQVSFFGSHEYSFEELVAEFGAAFLCGHAGIETKTIDNSASYIQSWLKVLKKDSKMLVSAASQAQKAANHILNVEIVK